MQQADLVLYLFDVNITSKNELLDTKKDLLSQNIKHLLVGNKIDQADENTAREEFNDMPNLLFISAIKHQHINNLTERMVNVVLEGQVQTENTVVTNSRHYHALQQLHSSLLDVRKGLTDRLPGDLLALDIRRSLHYLGEITGEITNEDQLDYIFSKFCIGK
jgi:tRNA modification GTPase